MSIEQVCLVIAVNLLVGTLLGFGLDQHQKAMTAARARAEA